MLLRNAFITGAFVLAVAALPATALFMRLDEPVPVDRLVQNVGAYVEANPDDAEGHYTLGRIHSLAYAKLAYAEEQEDDPEHVNVIPAEKVRERQQAGEEPAQLPGFPPYQSVQVAKWYEQPPRPSPEAGMHLRSSLSHYAKATQLEPDNALYWLGYGWMLEQAVNYGEVATGRQAPATRPTTLPATQPNGAPAPGSLRELAADAYRKALALTLEEELDPDTFILQAGDVPISREAATNLLRLIKADGVTDAEREEVARVEDALARLAERPMAITPIVFALENRPLEALLDRSAHITFDLAGDGTAGNWPWVTEHAALLVWDPNSTGRITSGTQLIGGRTWSMFWRDGYAALAALDDNRDGQLRGEELAGLAAWFDRDGNGLSDRGEVVPLQSLGVASLATAGESHADDDVISWQPAGVTFDDGRVLPTWDWQPTEVNPK